MKKLLLLPLLLLFAGQSFAQLSWTPYFDTIHDVITITYDASQGNAELKDFYPNQIYIHAGVITNKSTNPRDWKYVQTTWGSTTALPKPTYLGDNKWRFSLDIYKYYKLETNLTSGEKVLELAFVFRNADGTKVGRAADGSDMFIPVFDPGLNVAVISPSPSPYFVNIGDSVKVEAVSSSAKNLSLYINNNLVAKSDTNYISYYSHAESYGNTWIKAVATDSAGNTKTDSTYFVTAGSTTIEAEPDGIVDGINYISDTSAVFSLYAPGKKSVYVIGDFNSWLIEPKYQMNMTPDSSRFWLEVDGLTPGKEYVCQYLVDGTMRIADPYSEKILDPGSDKYIDSTTYPDLIQYPGGKTTQIATVIQTDKPKFNWQDTTFKRPDKQNLVIYELLVRDFVSTHNYRTLTDTISYFKRLGVNAIELMPVMEFEGNESWGYNPDFHMALDKYYGTPDAFKHFIDLCHQNGIAVILDIVLNQITGSSPLARLYWDSANNRPAADNPWLNPIPKHPFNVFNDFNHESKATQYYVDRITKYWLQEYHVDGYRFDLSKGFTQKYTTDVNAWNQYDQSRINILERMGSKIRQVDSSAYLILEHFAVNQEEDTLSHWGFMLWDNMNGAYSQASIGRASGTWGSWDLSGTSYTSRGWKIPSIVGYMESHDEERVMYRNEQSGNSNSSLGYNIKNIKAGLDRIKLCEAFFYTIPGPKMLWQFGELGYDISIDQNGRVGNKPILWNYYSDPDRLKLFKTTAALIKLKTEYPVFNTKIFFYNLSGTGKTLNLIDSTMDVTVIGNFGIDSLSITPNFPTGGRWYDYFNGDTLNITNPIAKIKLGPGEFHLYTTKKLPAPEQGITTGINDNKIGCLFF